MLIAILICALAGYAVGRTFIQESMFDGWSEKIQSWTRHQDDYENEIFVLDGVIMKRQETELGSGDYELVMISDTDLLNPFENRYARKAFMPISWLWGKIGELVSCVWCLSAQMALQFYFWTYGPWSFVPVTIPAMLAAAAITFAINDYVNAHNADED